MNTQSAAERSSFFYLINIIYTRVSLHIAKSPFTIVHDVLLYRKEEFLDSFLVLTCRAFFPALLFLKDSHDGRIIFLRWNKERKENRNNDAMGGAVECFVYYYRGLSSTSQSTRFRHCRSWPSDFVGSARLLVCCFLFSDWISGTGKQIQIQKSKSRSMCAAELRLLCIVSTKFNSDFSNWTQQPFLGVLTVFLLVSSVYQIPKPVSIYLDKNMVPPSLLNSSSAFFLLLLRQLLLMLIWFQSWSTEEN